MTDNRPVSQCEARVQFHKGVGYYASDVYEVEFHCQLLAGHEAPHVISLPEYADDDETGLSLPLIARAPKS